jgi:hypothetical protein
MGFAVSDIEGGEVLVQYAHDFGVFSYAFFKYTQAYFPVPFISTMDRV